MDARTNDYLLVTICYGRDWAMMTIDEALTIMGLCLFKCHGGELIDSVIMRSDL